MIIPWAFVLCVVFIALAAMARFGPKAFIWIMSTAFIFCMYMAWVAR